MRKWVLPEYIEDVLPAEAERTEALRRSLLDHFRARGYRLVQPPLVEHLDSLFTGTGRDLELQTFKVVDPLSGRLLGVRADITPQVARIDAHLLNEHGVTRLCYAGSVLRAVPAAGAKTREVMQIGAELFGEPAIAGDIEVLGLLLSSLAAAGLSGLHLDLGHVGVYRALAAGAGIAGNGEDTELFAALRAKDVPGCRRAHRQAARRVARRAHRVAGALRPGAGRAGRGAGEAPRHARDPQCAVVACRRSRSPRSRTSKRSTSISPT